jgi:hypothetical protein
LYTAGVQVRISYQLAPRVGNATGRRCFGRRRYCQSRYGVVGRVRGVRGNVVGRLTLLGFKPVSSRLDLSCEDLTPRQKETPVCREGVSVGHPRHEVYGLG